MSSQKYISSRFPGYQSIVVCKRYHWKIFEHVVTVAYLHVILFTMLEKDTVSEEWLEPSQTYMMKYFCGNR